MGPSTLAAGVRMPYEVLPEAVRRWVEAELGAPVTRARTQSGGFSPGVAARLETGAGRRAFLKAVGSPLNPDTPDLFRAEQAAIGAIGDNLGLMPWLPRLHAAYDDGTWVGLLLEDIEGRQPPHPWNPADVDRVFGALAELNPTLDPSPWPAARPCDLSGLARRCQELAAEQPADLPGWLPPHLDELPDLADRAVAAVTGPALIHLDIRADNLLLTDRPGRGGVVLVDWANARLGAPWADVTLAAADVIASGSVVDVDALLAGHPLTRDIDPALVTALVAALGGMLAQRGRAPAPPGLPTLRPWQRGMGDALLPWAGRRLGWR